MPRRFQLGSLVATPGALAALEAAGEGPAEFIDRHARGDWGIVNDEDKRANDAALEDESRIFSAYTTKLGVKLWIITEAVGDDGKRASTCILLPEEY